MKVLKAIPLAFAALAGTSALAGAPEAAGEVLFRQKCQACHNAAVSTPGPMAPGLAGVVGRKAASTAFPNYSPALKASGVVWTKANIDRYISGPGKMVPGTRMIIVISDPAQRAALNAYLASKR